jgi:hypothetical protein
MLPLGLFLAPDTQRGPRHSHESFCLDVFATTDTLAVLASVNCLQGIFNRSQALEIAFVQVIQKISVLADRGQIVFVFRVVHGEFFRSKPMIFFASIWSLLSFGFAKLPTANLMRKIFIRLVIRLAVQKRSHGFSNPFPGF